jgi:hypothetical protein
VFLEGQKVRRGILRRKRRAERWEKDDKEKKEKRKRRTSVLLLPFKYDLVCSLVGNTSQFDSDCCVLHETEISHEFIFSISAADDIVDSRATSTDLYTIYIYCC